MRQWIAGLQQPPSEVDLLIAAGDEASLRQALELDPGHEKARSWTWRPILVGEGSTELAATRRCISSPGSPSPQTPGTSPLRPGSARRSRRVSWRSTRWRPSSIRCSNGSRPTRRPARSSWTCSRCSARRPAHRGLPQGAHRQAVLSAGSTRVAKRRIASPAPGMVLPSSVARVRRPQIRHHQQVARDGDPQPDPRLVLRPGRLLGPDDFYARAEQLVLEGADILDVGGVKAGPGPEVSEAEEIDRVVPAIEALHARFDVPLSVDTWRAVGRAGGLPGRSGRGQRHQRVRGPGLSARGRGRRRLGGRHPHPPGPRVRDPEPHYDDVVADVAAFLVERARRARAVGLPDSRVILDAGLDLGKTAEQSAHPPTGLGPSGLARIPSAALGLQQDISRGAVRPRGRGATRGDAGGPCARA